MKAHLTTLVGCAALAALVLAQTHNRAAGPPAPDDSQPRVQIAILLDTSGSMSGLIEQTKSQLWKVVNAFIFARHDGRQPLLEVALYEYGKSSLSQESGWIRQIVPLSDDLDKISQELFALTTNGGDEYCGWVIRDAVQQLQWSDKPDVYKAVFIAGNEPFTQGPIDHSEACRSAIQRGIIVNTIHCGGRAEGIETRWQHGALLADGKYMVIDHNQAVVHFEAPQDAEIARLSAQLNDTYVPYGATGALGVQNQAAQDSNAARFSSQGSLVQRAVTKASSFYRNSNWDLVDAVKDNPEALKEVKESDLPDELKSMTLSQRRAFIETKSRKREEIQSKIQELNEARRKHVAEVVSHRNSSDTLDSAVLAAVREQAQAKGFEFNGNREVLGRE